MSKVSAVLRKVNGGYAHWCPGCEEMHIIPTEPPYHIHWRFNGNVEMPTFDPSVNHRWGKKVDPNFVEEDPSESGQCHYFIRNGAIEYCGDCTHPLSGQTVPLPAVP